VSTPAIVEALRALTAEILRSEEFRTALREMANELLAAQRPASSEMVPPSVFAREHSLNEATVRKMAKDGRIAAVRIGKRQWRVRRDSPIQPIRREERAKTGRELAIERAHQLVEKLGLEGGSR
jgi:hypothetical protein